jgi:CelD/BcsL family acetyltransferase involved in cellulose biosynthesis
VPDLAAVRTDWTRLAESTGNVFATWEWADAWHRHIGAPSGAELAVATATRPTGETAAILPLSVTRRGPLRLVRFVGAGPSDELGPICGPADRPAAAIALKRHVDETLGGSGIFLGERLWGDCQLARKLGGVVVRRASSPVLPIAGRSFDDFLAGRSRNFRNQVRRRERKLAAEYQLNYRLTEDPARLQADLQTLIELHAARWSGESTAFGGPREAFHREFAMRALQNGWLRLWTMELNGVPAAAWYGLRYAGVESYYQAGRDPALEEWNVGFVLLCHSIRCAFEDGASEYRFGLGDEGYKDRFAERDPGLDTVALTAGLRGRMALASIRAALALPAGARKTVLGLGRGRGT